jgi:hypothetical protein
VAYPHTSAIFYFKTKHDPVMRPKSVISTSERGESMQPKKNGKMAQTEQRCFFITGSRGKKLLIHTISTSTTCMSIYTFL